MSSKGGGKGDWCGWEYGQKGVVGNKRGDAQKKVKVKSHWSKKRTCC